MPTMWTEPTDDRIADLSEWDEEATPGSRREWDDYFADEYCEPPCDEPDADEIKLMGRDWAVDAFRRVARVEADIEVAPGEHVYEALAHYAHATALASGERVVVYDERSQIASRWTLKRRIAGRPIWA